MPTVLGTTSHFLFNLSPVHVGKCHVSLVPYGVLESHSHFGVMI